jgi:hypothetical protein
MTYGRSTDFQLSTLSHTHHLAHDTIFIIHLPILTTRHGLFRQITFFTPYPCPVSSLSNCQTILPLLSTIRYESSRASPRDEEIETPTDASATRLRDEDRMDGMWITLVLERGHCL